MTYNHEVFVSEELQTLYLFVYLPTYLPDDLTTCLPILT